MPTKTEAYRVMAKFKVECDLSIRGTSLEDALEEARKLKILDFIDFKGEFISDDGLEIQGLFKE